MYPEAYPRRGGYDVQEYGGEGYAGGDYYGRGGGYVGEPGYVVEEVVKRPSSLKGHLGSMSGSLQRGFGRMVRSDPMLQRGTEKKAAGKAEVFAARHPGTAAVVERESGMMSQAAGVPLKEVRSLSR